MGHETLIKCTVAGSLEWDDNNERAVDRVTAIGMSARRNELGAAMLHAEALDEAAMRKVILLVVRKLNHKHRIARGFANRIALAVLHETMCPGCIYCGGKGEIQQGDMVTGCSVCNGTGWHRYTDADRSSLVGGAYNKVAYDAALAQVRDALSLIVRTARSHLTDG